MTDLRPSFESFRSAFGAAATVTVPAGVAVAATIIWVPPVSTEYPADEYRRAEPVRVLAVGSDEVATVPQGTIINTVPVEGGAASNWKADQVARVDSDHYRVVVVPSV